MKKIKTSNIVSNKGRIFFATVLIVLMFLLTPTVVFADSSTGAEFATEEPASVADDALASSGSDVIPSDSHGGGDNKDQESGPANNPESGSFEPEEAGMTDADGSGSNDDGAGQDSTGSYPAVSEPKAGGDEDQEAGCSEADDGEGQNAGTPQEVSGAGQDEQANTGNSYKAELALDGLVEGTGGSLKQFTITFTELNKNGQKLGSAQVELPEGFSPAEGSLRVESSGGGKGWDGKIDDMFIYLWALDEAALLVQGQYVSATFNSATPEESGEYTLKTKAWTEANGSFSGIANNNAVNDMHSDYKDPVIVLNYQDYEKPGTPTNRYTHSLVPGLDVDITTEGNGYDISVFTIDRSVTSVIRFNRLARHFITRITYYSPDDEGWSEEVYYEYDPHSPEEYDYIFLLPLDIGCKADWSSYYFLTESPQGDNIFKTLVDLLLATGEFEIEVVVNKDEDELKELAHSNSIDYGYVEIEPYADQAWLSQVALAPGATGMFHQHINCALGNIAHLLDGDGKRWNAETGYEGSDDGFGLIDGEGYAWECNTAIHCYRFDNDGSVWEVTRKNCHNLAIEKGDNYLGDYIIVSQHLKATEGTIKQYKEISSGFSLSYLYENMLMIGNVGFREYFQNCSLNPGKNIHNPCLNSCPFKTRNHVFFDHSFYNVPTLMPVSRVKSSLPKSLVALQSVVGKGFVTSGTKAQLQNAKKTYQQLLRLYKANKAMLDMHERAEVETTLAVSWAAIQALEASLKAKEGEPIDLSLLIEAYNQAKKVLANNMKLLTSEQIASVEAILAEVNALIDALVKSILWCKFPSGFLLMT